jgi:hypothetical protein
MVLFGAVAVSLLLCSAGAFGFDLSAGVKVGITLPRYSGADYDDFLSYWGISTKAKFGLSGGAFATIGIIDALAFQPEVFFSVLGGNSGDSYYTFKDKAQGIDIHALLKARIKAGGRTRIDLFAGPNFFFNIGNAKCDVTDPYGNTVLIIDWRDSALRVPIIGIAFGVGLTYFLGKQLFSLDARYIKGLQSRFKDESGILGWYQDGIQVMIGIALIMVGKTERAPRLK